MTGRCAPCSPTSGSAGLTEVAYLGGRTQRSHHWAASASGLPRLLPGRGQRPHSALGDLGLQSGYRLAAELLTPTTQAMVCASDTLAIGAAKYLQEQGAPTSW